MTSKFSRATKKQARLRMGLIGPSGSGKTYSALSIAGGLSDKVALIDTERFSASKYADKFNFDVLELTNFDPKQYIEAIHSAEAEGYGTLVIDSLSHAWIGKGGVLEIADNISKRSQSKNTFNAWREATPQHNSLIDAILRSNLHVIATMRAKTEYVMEKDDRGKTVPRKVGIQPVQRDGMEYEFDVVADLDTENNLIIGKTRCSELSGKVFTRAGKDVADILKSWLSDGSPDLYAALMAELNAAKTKEELNLAAANIKANQGSLSEREVSGLRDTYTQLSTIK
jgi:hypothetical protein